MEEGTKVPFKPAWTGSRTHYTGTPATARVALSCSSTTRMPSITANCYLARVDVVVSGSALVTTSAWCVPSSSAVLRNSPSTQPRKPTVTQEARQKLDDVADCIAPHAACLFLESECEEGAFRRQVQDSRLSNLWKGLRQSVCPGK